MLGKNLLKQEKLKIIQNIKELNEKIIKKEVIKRLLKTVFYYAKNQVLENKRYKDIKDSNYFWIERTENSTIEETVRKAERHFGLVEKSIT